MDNIPIPASYEPLPLKLTVEPFMILRRLSPVPAVLIKEPLLIIDELIKPVAMSLSTVTVKSVEKSTTPPIWLLSVPPRIRAALLANSITPELFRVPVRSLFLVKSLTIREPVAPIVSSPAISPPRNTKLPLLILLPDVNIWVPLPMRSALGPAPPVAAKLAA